MYYKKVPTMQRVIQVRSYDAKGKNVSGPTVQRVNPKDNVQTIILKYEQGQHKWLSVDKIRIIEDRICYSASDCLQMFGSSMMFG